MGGEPAAALGTVKVRSGTKRGVIFKIKIVLLIKKYTPQDIEKPTKSMEKENIVVTQEQKKKQWPLAVYFFPISFAWIVSD